MGDDYPWFSFLDRKSSLTMDNQWWWLFHASSQVLTFMRWRYIRRVEVMGSGGVNGDTPSSHPCIAGLSMNWVIHKWGIPHLWNPPCIYRWSCYSNWCTAIAPVHQRVKHRNMWAVFKTSADAWSYGIILPNILRFHTISNNPIGKSVCL